ncbi:hypothetical protein [Nostoc sp.]|uniref:hypothetical protein n=1 Tax=Nostoc sp. TaxID=1180 RepID=UPI002FFB30F1
MVTRRKDKRLVVRVTKYELAQLQREADNRGVSNFDVLEGGFLDDLLLDKNLPLIRLH